MEEKKLKRPDHLTRNQELQKQIVDLMWLMAREHNPILISDIRSARVRRIIFEKLEKSLKLKDLQDPKRGEIEESIRKYLEEEPILQEIENALRKMQSEQEKVNDNDID
ncbi:MAG: hypothetical protein ACMG57_04070 [Candidatus Dojkabacteria bacterium]